MLTYAELKTAERAILWPSPGEPRNLRVAHDRFFDEAMIDLSQWVECLQVNNTTVHPACSGFVHCAKSVFPAPNGLIKRVYTLANEDRWCDRVDYRSARFIDLDQFARNLQLWWTAPDQRDLPALPQGFLHPSRNSNSICGRARTGVWAIYRHRLYTAPWLETNESLVVEWDGPKSDWKDDDIINVERWDVDARSAVRAYVKWRHEAEFGCNEQKIKRLVEEYQSARADLMHWCARYTEQQLDETSSETPRYPSIAEIQDSAVPALVDETVVFGNIGDYGTQEQSSYDVAAMINGKNPQFIITNGDNTYGSNYDDYVGVHYSRWIYPYSGAHEGGASENLFWPVPGNHDYDVDVASDLSSYKAFFTLPGNERYYELVRGPVHFFMLNSETEETDGVTSLGAQALWLKAKMALSTAKWKICVIHNAPYTSATNDAPGILNSRWPFELWGADLVLSGDAHGYERFEINGFPYIVNGAGGRTLYSFITPRTTGSQFSAVVFGAGLVTVTCDTLKYEFFDKNGVLLDTLTLTKD